MSKFTQYIILFNMFVIFTGATCRGAVWCVKEDPDKLLLQAAREGDVRKLNQALKNKKTNIDATDQWDFTALTCASARGHVEVVRILIASGATIDTIDRLNGTALLGAAQAGYGDVVDLLIHAKADSTAALGRAKLRDGVTVQFLRKYGAKSAESLANDSEADGSDSWEFEEKTSEEVHSDSSEAFEQKN